ncbi:MAG: YfiR family protein [Acidobacteriaceae bacterium]
MSGTRDQSSTVRMLMRLGCALLGCLLFVPLLPAQPLSEYDVEAAYLYDFGKFVRWPADAPKPPTFDICILGRGPFDGTLDRIIANNRIGGRPIQKRILSSPAQADGCAILYIADSEANNLRGILDALGDRQSLLVSGMPHFAQSGGTIQFVVEGDRVRFMVNLDAAAKCHLTLSSELLKVALSVTGRLRNGVTQ